MIVFRAKKGVLNGEICTKLDFKPIFIIQSFTVHSNGVMCYQLHVQSQFLVAGNRMIYVVPAFRNVTM